MQPATVPKPIPGDAAVVFLRMPTVVQVTGLGRSSIYRLIKARQFPRPCRLAPRTVAWRKVDIDAWTQARPLSGD